MALYVVTGGAGFIGSHLADALLAGGHAVRIIDDLSTGRRANLDPRCDLMVGDVCDAHLLDRACAGAVGIFHLAAIASVARSNEDWFGTHRVNASGTVAVLDAARRAGRIPVAYASSAAIYGDQGEVAIREDAQTRPMTAYGADKLASELHGAVAQGVHAVPAMGFRFFNVYGPRQDPSSPYSGVISIFARRIPAGETVTLHGDGGQTRDFVFVADVVRHLMAGMELLLSGTGPHVPVLNVCTGRATSILDLAREVSSASGMPLRAEFGPSRPGDIRHSLGNPGAARATLGVSSDVTLPEGMRATLGG